jgi:hypothetical protein
MRRFAILYPEEAYGYAFMEVFWEEVARQGGSVVGVESYATDQTDFETPIRKLVGLHYPVPSDLQRRDQPLTLLGPDGTRLLAALASAAEQDDTAPSARSRSLQKIRTPGLGIPASGEAPIVDFEGLFIPDAPGKVGLIVPQLAYHDVAGVSYFGTNLWQSDKFLERAGEFLEGAVFPSGFFIESRKPAVQRFAQRFESIYGRPPEFIEAIAYDSARIMIAALLSPDAWLRSGTRHRLLTMDGFDGITGFTRFSREGEAEKVPFMLQVRNRGFQELESGTFDRWTSSGSEVPPPIWTGADGAGPPRVAD